MAYQPSPVSLIQHKLKSSQPFKTRCLRAKSGKEKMQILRLFPLNDAKLRVDTKRVSMKQTEMVIRKPRSLSNFPIEQRYLASTSRITPIAMSIYRIQVQ